MLYNGDRYIERNIQEYILYSKTIIIACKRPFTFNHLFGLRSLISAEESLS